MLEGRGHRALALSLPGGRWDDEVTYDHEQVGGAEMLLVGHALGGLLARAYASVHAGVLRGLATIATPPAAGQVDPSVEFDVPGDERRIAIICEGDEVVPYDDQRAAAAEWRAQPGSVPGGHDAHRRHPALVATLLINWLAPETA